ncbi:MAG: ABC transporter ATP-binding protein [bacterium]
MEMLIRVDNLKKHYSFARGLLRKKVSTVRAVDGVSFDIRRGETFGLVGESGSGKTTVARLALRLIEPTANTIYFGDTDIFRASGRELAELRRKTGIVFQDPAASLNPRATILDSLRRPLEVHGVPRQERDRLVAAIADRVSLGEELLSRYPHQLSGGQQQRASIARAIILHPEFIVLDEPTSALDVSVQAQILNLLLDLQQEYKLTYLFITHNLSVVRYVSDRIGVMYLGRLMEIAPTDAIYAGPIHPYTIGLLSSAPTLSPRERERRKLILSGEPPSLINPPPGCRLAPRCPFRKGICDKVTPELAEIKPGHFVACHRAGEHPLVLGAD